jgi:hypothetical protein
MQRTRYKYFVLLLFMAVISSVAYAEKGDNTAPPSIEQKPAFLKTTSYFQGTWVGNWKEKASVTSRDVTITVGSKNPDGTFDIEYSWGSGQEKKKGRPILPGTVKTKGREDGEKLVFEFSDRVNFGTSSIVMTKYEDARAKAEMEYAGEKRMMKLEADLTRN